MAKELPPCKGTNLTPVVITTLNGRGELIRVRIEGYTCSLFAQTSDSTCPSPLAELNTVMPDSFPAGTPFDATFEPSDIQEALGQQLSDANVSFPLSDADQLDAFAGLVGAHARRLLCAVCPRSRRANSTPETS